MSKSHLIEVVAKEADISKIAATRAVNALFGAIVDSVANQGSIKLVGFGTFKPAQRAARAGRNPKTGKVLDIPAATVPRFTAGATFKAAVARKNGAAFDI